MDTHPECGACAPKLHSWQEREKFEYAGAAGGYIDLFGYPFCRGRILNRLETDKGQYDTPADVFWATGACLMVRSSLYRRLGGLDDRFFAHMEEIDLCWRMQLEGFKVTVVPESVVYHLGGGTLPASSPFKLFLNYRNNLTMLYKCAPTMQRFTVAILRPLADLLSVLIYLLKGEMKLAAATLRAYRDFFALHKELSKKRKAVRSSIVAESGNIYRGSMVVRYMLGRHKFDNMI